MEQAIRMVAEAVPARTAARLRDLLSADEQSASSALGALCEEPYRRTLAALLHDTVSPNQVHAGVKYNIIPGSAWIELDCRLLPGTSVEDMTAHLRERIGRDLLPFCEIEPTLHGDPVEQPTDTPLYRLLGETLRAHDPDGIPVPIMAPFATDAEHLARLGVPTYGFAPLRLDPADAYLDLFHGDDERVSLDALRFGFPVLYDVVLRNCTE
jgi:acetylornithine deacetylase/succinyl-diaminopimelate desuccinylase-like protein